MHGVALYALEGIPEIRPGDDIVREILASADRGPGIGPGDILVVTHKIVSKAEGRLVDLAGIVPSPFAAAFGQTWGKDPRQVEVVLREARRIVKMANGVLITETKHGLICANSGVDASNVPGDCIVCLLPLDPDASAEHVRRAIAERTGREVAVIISDSFGRAWRNGIVNVAIGVAGMDPFADYRGHNDPHGYPLVASRLAIADELAAAAELVMGKLDARPVAIVRGYAYGAPSEGASHGRHLIMDAARDLFR